MASQPIDRRRIEEILFAALEREPAERAVFLDGACFGEPEARALVEDLLRHAQEGDDFLAEPPFGSDVRLDDLIESEAAAGPLPDQGIDGLLGPESPAGRRIGSYVLRAELGRGGQGHVYLAHDERLERDVALKLLPETSSYSDRARQRFEREATAASRLDHPGICTVFEIGDEKGVPFIAMQYVEGLTLQQRIDEAAASGPPADCAELVRFAELAALALHAAHEKGLIHRDVKPANIMVTPEGQPVILDFGLAYQDSEEATIVTKPDGLMGTPAYMSPEQVDPQGRPIDRRTDVYSLGATLHEGLTLRRPFVGQTSRELYLAALSQELPDPRKLNPAIPRDLGVVVQKAMAKEREQRYATALELAQDLGRIRRFEPIQARPPSLAYRLSRFYRRNRAACTAAALGLAVVASLVAWFALLDPWLERRVALGDERRALLAIVEEKRLVEDAARDRLARAQAALVSDPELARSIAAEMEQAFRDRDRALPTLPAGLRFESEHRADRELAAAFEPYRLHLAEAALLVAALCHASDEVADRTQVRTAAASRAFTWATSRDAPLDEERALAALIHLGDALYESGRFSQAGVTFEGALSSLPSAHDSASVFFGLGRAQVAQQEFAEAAGAFARGLELGLELEHGGALARYAERALAIQGALLPEREFDLEGLPVGTGDMDGDGTDELICYDLDGNLFAYALSGGGGKPLSSARRVARGRWFPLGAEVVFESIRALVDDVCGDERLELVLAWANPTQGTGRISVYSLTANGRLEEIAWSSCKDDIGDMAAVDVDGDGANELWIGHGYFGRALVAYRVPGGIEAAGDPLEMEPFFRQELGSDVDSFLFGDFDSGRDGLELALVLGAWTHQRIALGHVDLSAGRLHIMAVTDGNVCGAETSLHGCAWEPGAFLVLHTYTAFSIENYQLEGLPLLPIGLLLARPGAGVLPPPTPLMREGARVEGRREPSLRHSSVLSCDLRGVGPCLLWLEEGSESDRMRVTPAAMTGDALATPILVDNFAESDLLSGDLDGDGFDEVLAMKPSAPGRPRRIRVLGLDDEAQRAVEPYLKRGIAGPSVQRSQEWPKRLMKLGCYREAVAAYEHALSGAEPTERQRIETELAACYLEMGSLGAAAAAYARAAESGSEDEASRALFSQAEVLVDLRSWEGARDVLAALDERYLSPGEDARLRALEDEVESALDLAEPAPLFARESQLVPLVENPLATTVAGEALVLRAGSTRAPRLAIPLAYGGRMFELHFDVEALRADWQTVATVTLEDEPFFSAAADPTAASDLTRSRSMIRFEADGATADPTRWVTVRAADAVAETIPGDLDPGRGFRYELGQPVHVGITYLPASAKLQVDLSNAEGEAVQRDWFELKRPFDPRRTIWLQFGMGAFQSTPGGHYNEIHVSALELRARNLRPEAFEPRSVREHLVVANGHFARGELAAAIAGYDAVLVGLAEASVENARLQAECHFWRGMARERTAPGTGRDDVLAAFELAPGVSLGLVEGGWPGMTALERALVTQVFEERVLRGRTELTWELLAELGLEPQVEGGAEDRPLYLLAPAVGLELLFALFSSMPEVAAQRALIPEPAQVEDPTLEPSCLQAELVFDALDPTAAVETLNALSELGSALTACHRDGHEHAPELRTCLDLALAAIDALPARPPALPGLLLYFAHLALGQDELAWCEEFLSRYAAQGVQDPTPGLEAEILTARLAAKRGH